jgi:hypothetical protein
VVEQIDHAVFHAAGAKVVDHVGDKGAGIDHVVDHFANWPRTTQVAMLQCNKLTQTRVALECRTVIEFIPECFYLALIRCGEF